jgi:hypothetical protein
MSWQQCQSRFGSLCASRPQRLVEIHVSTPQLPRLWIIIFLATACPYRVSPYTDPNAVPSTFQRHGVLLAASELASV